MKTISFKSLDSNVLQALQYSLRKGYASQKDKKLDYTKDRHLNSKVNLERFDSNMALLEKIFKFIDKELRKRKAKERLRKCYGDFCHAKCSFNCRCGWCLLRQGWEPLI